jgi:all-trans-8'-apo-beta-carotenal 15,15'-oxygenase
VILRESPVADFAPGLERAFSFVPQERSGPVTIEGEIPDFLRGTYYLNGPARFQRGDVRYRHWLDGDGMVAALRIAPEGAAFTCRFVRGEKLAAEEEAGAPLFRAFGTAFPGDRLVRGIALASPVNVSVYPFAGRLLAFGEQGLPWELDPATLATRGPYIFGGGLNPVSPFAAHPKIDPESGELWNFGISFAADQPSLNLYRFTAGGQLLARRRAPLPAPCSLHDFCLAPRHAFFYLSPYLLDMAALGAGRTLLEALAWEPQRGSRLLVLDRESGEVAASLPVGPGYCLHGVNAWEEEGLLGVDILELERPVYDQYRVPELFPDVAPGGPVRYLIDLATGTLRERRQLSYRQAPDFPAIDPRRFGQRADDVWMLGISRTGRPGRKFFDQLVRTSFAEPERHEVWQAPPGSYLAGEPAFVPDPGSEHGGAVLCPLYDAERDETAFLVFDAYDLAAGPQAELRLDEPLHLAFHAVFAPAG